MKGILLNTVCAAAIAAGGSLMLAAPARADTCDVNGTNSGSNAADANAGATSAGSGALGCGKSAAASGSFSTSAGAYSSSSGPAATAVGAAADSAGYFSVAVGAASTTAVTSGTQTDGNVAIGGPASLYFDVNGVSSVSGATTANGGGATAIGQSAQATG